ncbi:MAG: hypothetical protein AAB686_03770 [Patescibacteria group bacterium]
MHSDIGRQLVMFLALVGILAAALFGFRLMSNSAGAMTGCNDGGIMTGICHTIGVLEHIDSHLQAFRSLSTAVAAVVASAWSVLVLVLVMALASTVPRLVFTYKSAVIRRRDEYSPRPARFLRWLTLHEKRDPAATLI